MPLLPPPGAPWSARLVELSDAEQAGRYAPEFDTDRTRPPVPATVGVSD